MKNIRLMSFATMLVALFMSVGAFAQDVNLSVEKTYMQPGSTAKLTVKIDNNVTFGTVRTGITLPEGLTFVKDGEADENGIVDFVYSKTELTKGNKVNVVFSGATDNKATLTVGKSTDFSPCKGDFIVIDVNVADNFAIAGDVTFSDVRATRYDLESDSYENWELADFTAKVYNEADLCTPSVEDFEIAKGGTKNVAFGFAFDKAVGLMSFNVELPEGLTIDEDSYTPAADRIPNHQIVVKKSGRVTVRPTATGDMDFAGNSGTLFTFDVTASEDFEGGEIKFYNIEALTQADENDIVTTYYAKDFTVNVKASAGETGINGIETIGEGADGIYQLNGVRTDKMQRGVNIVVKDGKAIKVVKK